MALASMLQGLGTTVSQADLQAAFTLEDVMTFRRTAEDELLYTRWRATDTGLVNAHWVRVDVLNRLQQFHVWLQAHGLQELHKTLRQHQLGTNTLVMRSVTALTNTPAPSPYDHYIMPRSHYALPSVRE
jgi:hypothetical protein